MEVRIAPFVAEAYERQGKLAEGIALLRTVQGEEAAYRVWMKLGELLPLKLVVTTHPRTTPEFHNGTPDLESNGFLMQP